MKSRSLLSSVWVASIWLGLSLTSNLLLADEGMWLFNQPPKKLLHDKYQFDVTEEWLEHLQKASVRFNSGGSGAFVSKDGLVLSNHHVAADALQKAGYEENGQAIPFQTQFSGLFERAKSQGNKL